jgi:hypothetical protein
LYFDGNDDFMRLYDIRLNFEMTIHVWVNIFSETGFIFSLETATHKSSGFGDIELAVKLGVENDAQKIYGVWDATTSSAGDASCFMENWRILAFRFEPFNDTGATSMKLWCNDSLLISY